MADRCEHGMSIDLECADCLALENERLRERLEETRRYLVECDEHAHHAYGGPPVDWCRHCLKRGRDEARTALAAADDERDVWDFYWNHHLNTGGERCYAIDSPLGMQWSVLTRWRTNDEWERRKGPGPRNDWSSAFEAARECRRIGLLRGVWGSIDEQEEARAAAMSGDGEE